jgi:hypothetical protein
MDGHIGGREMDPGEAIYLVSASVEDTRPIIDFTHAACQKINWQRIDEVLHGQRPVADYQEVSIPVEAPDATSWDYYSVPGTLGLISHKATELIGHSAFRLYQVLLAHLNGEQYYFLRPTDLLPCLDRENSEVVTFRSNPSRIKEIKKYSFKKELIDPYLFFCIPESASLFATEAVYQVSRRGKLAGFDFQRVD